MADDGPKIQIDSDWKAEAQREKQRLAEQAKARQEAAAAKPGVGASAGARGGAAGSGPAGSRELPPASFETLMAQLATQALMHMGGYADPRTGQPILDLDIARHHIDMLGVLENITKGNLSDEESRTLASTLYELRGRYVQVANASLQKA